MALDRRCSGRAPVTRLPRPDFLASAPRPGPLAWAAAGTGALVLALGVVDVLGLNSRIADQQVRLQMQLAAAEARAQTAPNRSGRAASAAAPDTRAVDAEARVLRRLGYPWQQLFTTLEEATPAGVQWLALDHGTDRADVRLAGQARDAAQAVALVDELAAWAGWSDVVLRKLTLRDPLGGVGMNPVNLVTPVSTAIAASMGGPPALFEVEARFDTPDRLAVPTAPSPPGRTRAP